MSGEFSAKRNCARGGTPYLTFDGLTDDSLCFEYMVSSALLTPKQISSTECKDYYVQGGNGKKTVSSSDICQVDTAPAKGGGQSNVVGRLQEVGTHTFSSEMHALSEALAPFAIAAAKARESDGYRWERFDNINQSIVGAKRALCMKEGYKKFIEDTQALSMDKVEVNHLRGEHTKATEDADREIDDYVANAYRQCKEEDSGFWKNLWAGIRNLHGDTFKSLFMDVQEAENIISSGMRDLEIKENEQELLLLMYLPNILKELVQRKVTEENLFKRSKAEASSPLRTLSSCDLQLLAYFKSVVPTLSFGMMFGEAQVRQYTGGKDFMEQAFKVLGDYEIDLGMAGQYMEEALESEDPNEAIANAQQARAILTGIPKLGDPAKLDEAIAALDPTGWKNAAAIKAAISRAAKSAKDYENNIAIENASDMSSAVNAMIFMIDSFAKRTERREFGKVLLATLWMNAAVDATDSVRRGNAIARARDLLKQVSLCKSGEPCNLSAAERRWFEHINRLLGLLSSVKGSNLGCLEGQVQENNQCWDTAESCMSRVPSEAFDASSRMCVPCESDQRVKVTAKDAKGRAIETTCAKKSIHIVTVQSTDTSNSTSTSNETSANKAINCDLTPNQKMKLDQDPEKKKAYNEACSPKKPN